MRRGDGASGWTAWLPRLLNRRGVLLGAGGIGALAGVRTALAATGTGHTASPSHDTHAVHGGMTTVGEVDYARNGFDPHTLLSDWDRGRVGQTDDGRVLREFTLVAEDKEIEIA